MPERSGSLIGDAEADGWIICHFPWIYDQPSLKNPFNADLHKSGVLTDEEFAAAKKKVLG